MASSENKPHKARQKEHLLIDDRQFQYLIESYKLAIAWTDSYANRIYNRFNIFLGINVAIASLSASTWFNVQLSSPALKIFMPSLGLIVALLMYIQSAQDNYILRKSRDRVNKIRKKIEITIGRNDIPSLFSPLDETDTKERNFIFESTTSWRSNFISVTRIPSITSLIFVGLWIVIFVVQN